MICRKVKSISRNPARGDVFDCILGNYEPEDPKSPEGPFKKDNYDIRIPNEIRKRRPVIIVGNYKSQYLVVPISSTQDMHKKPNRTAEARKLHIRLTGDEVPETPRYKRNKTCWAKADLVQSVDEKRLREFRLDDGTHVIGKVSPETLRLIQEGVMRAIGLSAMLDGAFKEPEKTAAAEVAETQ